MASIASDSSDLNAASEVENFISRMAKRLVGVTSVVHLQRLHHPFLLGMNRAGGVGGFHSQANAFAFAVALNMFPGWFEWKIRGHEQGIHPHRRRA
jgi:hypothetical protein